MNKKPQVTFENPAIVELLKLYEPVAALNYFDYLAGWDTETFLPPGGINARGKAQSELSVLIQSRYSDPEFQKAFKLAKKQKHLNEFESALLKNLSLIMDLYQKLPSEFVKEFSRVTAEASVHWSKARSANKPEDFLPWLEKIFELTKRKAEFLGYQEEPYDALFKFYENDISTKELVIYFDKMKKFLKGIDLQALTKKTASHYADAPYDKEKLMLMTYQVLDLFGYDPNTFRLDESAHPFSLFLDPTDIRLTTRFHNENFSQSLLASIHEFGHGLFFPHAGPLLVNTPLWPETSYALHESQSRFWENMLGRSHGFSKFLAENLPGVMPAEAEVSDRLVWEHLNHIEPALIRVEADEITYHWHIIIRFEIERAVLNGELKVSEIEKAWNNKYQEYLGITPPDAKHGFMQDIHWSFGNLGYFPTYSLGSVTSALWLEKLQTESPIDLDKKFTKPEMLKLNDWFKNRVHRFAGTYALDQIWQRETGAGLNPEPWFKYIRTKYGIA